MLSLIQITDRMTKQEVFKIFNIEDLKDLPNAVIALLEGDLDARNEIYRELIRLNNNDMSYDWFQEMYESELAERKQKGQDFTSPEVSRILSDIIGRKGVTIHEPTAGCGGLLIVDWWKRCNGKLPWQCFPSQNMITCWELSNRSIPILLLNLSIRGIMGYVYHGDVLENDIKQKYILLNRKDDTLGFSEVIKCNINAKIMQEYEINRSV